MENIDLTAVEKQQLRAEATKGKEGIYVEAKKTASGHEPLMDPSKYLMDKIRGDLQDSLSSAVGGNVDDVRQSIHSSLHANVSAMHKQGGIVDDYEVHTQTVVETWSDLYHSRWALAKAWVAHKVFKLGSTVEKAKWYHILLGYEKKFELKVDEEFYEALVDPTFELVDAVGKYVVPTFWYELKYPQTYIKSDT